MYVCPARSVYSAGKRYQVMLYSFLDTHDPARNMPAPIDDAGLMNR